MYHVYKIIQNGDVMYVGCTSNIRRRKDQHNENIRKEKSKLGKIIVQELTKDNFKIVASFENRAEALSYERKLTKQIQPLCNDNYTDCCSRKGKNLGNTAKKYVVVNLKNHEVIEVENLRQWCIKNDFSYKSMQDTVSKTWCHKETYKCFYLDVWLDLKDKDYVFESKQKKERKGKTYLVKEPNGNIIEVNNLDKFASENGINKGNLHASYNGKKAKGYKVIERI